MSEKQRRGEKILHTNGTFWKMSPSETNSISESRGHPTRNIEQVVVRILVEDTKVAGSAKYEQHETVLSFNCSLFYQ